MKVRSLQTIVSAASAVHLELLGFSPKDLGETAVLKRDLSSLPRN